MISRADLQTQLHQVGLGNHAAILADHARPSITIERVVINDESQLAVGTSKLGGSPDLPENFNWPQHNDRPLIFLAQFNLAELTAYDVENTLPDVGLLYFFYDRLHSEAAFVHYHPSGETTGLFRHPHPTSGEDIKPLPAARLNFNSEWSFPSDEYLHNSIGEHIDGLHDDKLDLYDLLQLTPQFPNHTLLGHPYEIQGDVRYEVLMDINDVFSTREVKQWVEEKRGEEWMLLFQMDTDDGTDSLQVMWGDAGMLYFMIPEHALAQHDFSTCRVIMQCY